MKNKEILVVIHLSANAVLTVIGEVHNAQDIRIIGVGQVENHDFYQGLIRHRERLKSAIKESIQKAEDMSNCRVMTAWLSFSTPELVSDNGFGRVDIADTVQTTDIYHALLRAKQPLLTDNLYLLHYCQLGIYLDNNREEVFDAIGASASQIEVIYHLMMIPVNVRQDLQSLLQECDIGIEQMIFDAVSTAEYGLLPEERQQGVCLIDIGSGTTSICVYVDNKLILTHCFAEGGHDVTLDIASELEVTVAAAEYLKKYHATVDKNNLDASKFITLDKTNHLDERTINMQSLFIIAEARYISILSKIYNLLEEKRLLGFLQQGFVIAGGGAEMQGLLPLTRHIFRTSVKKITPHPAISPFTSYEDDNEKLKELSRFVESRECQTAFGTLLFSQSETFRHSEKNSLEKSSKPPSALDNFQKVNKKLHNLFKKFF